MTTETLNETASPAPKFSVRTVLHNAGIGLALLLYTRRSWLSEA